MSEETKTTEQQTTTTDENLQPLYVQVPWAMMNKATNALHSLTGHVSDKYVIHALSERVIALEQEVQKAKPQEAKTEVVTEKL